MFYVSCLLKNLFYKLPSFLPGISFHRILIKTNFFSEMFNLCTVQNFKEKIYFIFRNGGEGGGGTVN